MSSRYVKDEFETSQSGAGLTAPSRQTLTDLRQEIFLLTHSYIYHPGLLSLDVGGGPIFQSGSSGTERGTTHASGTLYNLTARATVLRDKPYRGAVFYEHLNPVMSIAPGQVLNQQNTRYGLDFALLAPVIPFPINFDMSRTSNQGSGADRIIDDRIDRANLRTTASLGAWGFTQAQYQITHQESRSGSPNLQIQNTTQDSQNLNVDTRVQWGAEKQYSLSNILYLSTQKYTFDTGAQQDRKDMRFTLNLRARHSAALNTFALFNHSASQQGDLNSANDALSAGLNYIFNPDTSAGTSVHNDTSRIGLFSSVSRGIEGSVRHRQPLPIGDLQVSYSLRYDQREQRTGTAQISVVGERVVLSGITASSLANLHVSAGGVTVSNTARTQTYIEGIDYTLTLVGAQTRVQRLAGGNILDGEEVLVNYAYDTGGNFAYTQIDHTLNATWNLTRYLNTYFRLIDSEPRLTSGISTFPLNTVHSNVYGLRADYPFRWGVEYVLGGNLEREDRRETIAPYRRTSGDVYAQVEDPYLGAGNLRLAARRNHVEYQNALQNVNLVAYDLRYLTRHPSGVVLSLNASRESDDGGVTPRQRLLTSLKAQWRYRKFSLSAELANTRETQSPNTRTRVQGQIFLKREI